MSRAGLGGCISALLVLALAPPTAAHAQQATDATLTLQIAGGQTVFRVGEVIPLELSFSTTAVKTYRLANPCFTPDVFHVSPPGTDPLARLHAALPSGYGCGGATGWPRYLGIRPQHVYETLNDEVALLRPGQYSLYITSHRLTRRDGAEDQPVELRSNTVDFEIVASTPQWQAQELASATEVLRDPSSTLTQRISALRILRFLDSPGSVEELVRQLSLPAPLDPQECFDGLLGSAHPQLVLRDLEERFASPNAAITPPLFNALADAEFLARHGPTAPYPRVGAAQQREWQAKADQRGRELQQLENALYQRAADLVPSKQDLAQAETVRMLVTWPYAASAGYAAPAHIPGDALATAFLRLPPDQQAQILENWWDRVDVQEMSSALESILNQSALADGGLRDIALRRLYEMDPGAGAAEIIGEIQRLNLQPNGGTVSAKTLGMLPDKTLPQFDSLLAAGLTNDRTTDLDASLIGRYATKAILPQVKAAYLRVLQEPGAEDCAFEDGLLVYFLRTDPDFAVEHAGLSAHLCTPHTFRLLSKMGLWSKVQPRIIAKLGDPNPPVASQAARELLQYGDAKAEQALWARLRSFHRQWAGAAREFVLGPGTSLKTLETVQLQGVLVLALADAQNWLLDDSQITELANLTLGPEAKQVAGWGWKSPLEVNLSFYGQRFFGNIGPVYQTSQLGLLCAKLGQFPTGTTLRVVGHGPHAQLAPMILRVEQAAERDGLVVQSGSAGGGDAAGVPR